MIWTREFLVAYLALQIGKRMLKKSNYSRSTSSWNITKSTTLNTVGLRPQLDRLISTLLFWHYVYGGILYVTMSVSGSFNVTVMCHLLWASPQSLYVFCLKKHLSCIHLNKSEYLYNMHEIGWVSNFRRMNCRRITASHDFSAL